MNNLLPLFDVLELCNLQNSNCNFFYKYLIIEIWARIHKTFYLTLAPGFTDKA